MQFVSRTAARDRVSPNLLMVVCLAAVSDIRANEKAIADLEREANQVLSEPDNIVRRARIAPVFQLAERFAAAGKTNEALKYYTKALEHQPWNLDAQLALARLQDAGGDTNSARQKLELVWKHAETDALLAQAASLLGLPFATKLDQESLPTETFALALVPYGETDVWLLVELREDLKKTLGVPVIIRQSPLQIPQPDRDSLHLRAEDLRERIAKARKDPGFEALLRRLNFAPSALAEDEQVFVVTEAVLNAEKDKEPAKRFREELTFLRRLGPQWDANELIRRLGTSLAVKPGSGMGYLGVTRMDLYSNESRYVFGLAAQGANCGIFSYRRYTSAVAEDPPNRERLRARSLKQALSTVGLLFGLPRCTDPTCARAYVNSLAEHDAKQGKLCPQCQQGFAKRFGRKAD